MALPEKQLSDSEPLALDAATFARFQAGDPAAMTAVVAAVHVRLLGFLRLFTRQREVAEELAQEVFLDAWHQRAEIHGVEKLRPWLFTLAKRKALREMGRKRYAMEICLEPEQLSGASPAVEGEQHRGLAERDVRRALQAALAELAEDERELVTLRYFGGLQIKELAAALGMPMGTVGTKLTRSLQKVRTRLEARGLRMDDLI